MISARSKRGKTQCVEEFFHNSKHFCIKNHCMMSCHGVKNIYLAAGLLSHKHALKWRQWRCLHLCEHHTVLAIRYLSPGSEKFLIFTQDPIRKLGAVPVCIPTSNCQGRYFQNLLRATTPSVTSRTRVCKRRAVISHGSITVHFRNHTARNWS